MIPETSDDKLDKMRREEDLAFADHGHLLGGEIKFNSSGLFVPEEEAITPRLPDISTLQKLQS